MEDLPRIQNLVAKNDITFVTCGLGGSLLKAAQTLRDAGARVDRAVCVVDREEGALEMLRGEDNKRTFQVWKSDL